MNTKIITILGKKGCGKSTYMKKLLNESKRPCIVFDLFNQFDVNPIFYDVVDFFTYLEERNNKLYNRKYRFCIYDKIDFEVLCKFASKVGNIDFFVDEIDMFDSANSSIKSFLELIHYSRHYGINLYTTSRRPQRISRDLTSQTDKFVFFRITERRDLAYIEALSTDLAEAVRKLEKFHFIEYAYEDDFHVSLLTFDKKDDMQRHTIQSNKGLRRF